MKVEVLTPEEFFGDVLGDVNSRRGRVLGIEARSDAQAVRALVPLAETFGYTTELRSLTQGRATQNMEFDHYQEVPPGVVDKLGIKVKHPVRA
jgi:elongation factor G